MNNEEHPGSLLLIEDHRDIAEMVFAYFENRGYTVDCAADGITGLHLAVTQDLDAIILDLMLPGLDGLSARRCVHAGCPECTGTRLGSRPDHTNCKQIIVSTARTSS